MFRKLRTTYEQQTFKERRIFELQQAGQYFEQLDGKALSFLQAALIKLLDPKLIATHLPQGSQLLGASFKELQEASDELTLSWAFLDILYYPFGQNHLGSQSNHYHSVRDAARHARNNHQDARNVALFKGTQHLPYINGFSMHGYTFARFLAINKNVLPPGALELIIPFFYFNYIRKGFHSFAEIDAAFLRASEDTGCKELDFLSLKEEKALGPESAASHLPAPAPQPEIKNAGTPDPAILELEVIKDKICGKLKAEMTHFLSRKNFPAKTLSEEDRSRYQVLRQLHDNLGTITNQQKAAIQQKVAGNWKLTYKKALTAAIETSLLNDKLDKYNCLEKIGIGLLNFVSFVFFSFQALHHWHLVL